MSSDHVALQRFVVAQDQGETYQRALTELRRGRKESHWMWYVLPQLAGLGSSPMAEKYGISSLAQAAVYVAHPVLGPRLLDCATALVETGATDPVQVMGAVDSLKLRSSMTLFEKAAPDQKVFTRVLEQYFGGKRDDATLAKL